MDGPLQIEIVTVFHDMPTATAQQKRDNKVFWLSLGFDQYVHHLTNLLLAWILLSS